MSSFGYLYEDELGLQKKHHFGFCSNFKIVDYLMNHTIVYYFELKIDKLPQEYLNLVELVRVGNIKNVICSKDYDNIDELAKSSQFDLQSCVRRVIMQKYKRRKVLLFKRTIYIEKCCQRYNKSIEKENEKVSREQIEELLNRGSLHQEEDEFLISVLGRANDSTLDVIDVDISQVKHKTIELYLSLDDLIEDHTQILNTPNYIYVIQVLNNTYKSKNINEDNIETSINGDDIETSISKDNIETSISKVKSKIISDPNSDLSVDSQYIAFELGAVNLCAPSTIFTTLMLPVCFDVLIQKKINCQINCIAAVTPVDQNSSFTITETTIDYTKSLLMKKPQIFSTQPHPSMKLMKLDNSKIYIFNDDLQEEVQEITEQLLIAYELKTDTMSMTCYKV